MHAKVYEDVGQVRAGHMGSRSTRFEGRGLVSDSLNLARPKEGVKCTGLRRRRLGSAGVRSRGMTGDAVFQCDLQVMGVISYPRGCGGDLQQAKLQHIGDVWRNIPTLAFLKLCPPHGPRSRRPSTKRSLTREVARPRDRLSAAMRASRQLAATCRTRLRAVICASWTGAST